MSDALTIRLGDELATALRAEAEQTGVAKGEIVRQALEQRLKGSRKLSAMSRHFGSMRGPADLSTNKSYRKKWGKTAA